MIFKNMIAKYLYKEYKEYDSLYWKYYTEGKIRQSENAKSVANKLFNAYSVLMIEKKDILIMIEYMKQY